MSSTVTRSGFGPRERMKPRAARVGGEALRLTSSRAGAWAIAATALRMASSSSGIPGPSAQASANQRSGVRAGSPGKREGLVGDHPAGVELDDGLEGDFHLLAEQHPLHLREAFSMRLVEVGDRAGLGDGAGAADELLLLSAAQLTKLNRGLDPSVKPIAPARPVGDHERRRLARSAGPGSGG